VSNRTIGLPLPGQRNRTDIDALLSVRRPSDNSITDRYTGPESIYEWRFSRYNHPALVNFIGGSLALANNSLEFDRIVVLLRRRRALFIEPDILWPRCFIDSRVAISHEDEWINAFDISRYDDVMNDYLVLMKIELSDFEKIVLHELILSWWIWCTCPYSNFPEVESSQGWYIQPAFPQMDKFLERYSWHVSIAELEDERTTFSIGSHIMSPLADQFAHFYDTDPEAGAKGYSNIRYQVKKYRDETPGSSPVPSVAEDAFMITLDGIEKGKCLYDDLPISESLMFPGVMGVQRLEDPTIHIHIESMSLSDIYEARTVRDFAPLVQDIINNFNK
jgi:hypothetical protein